jgi:hypothetical protein
MVSRKSITHDRQTVRTGHTLYTTRSFLWVDPNVRLKVDEIVDGNEGTDVQLCSADGSTRYQLTVSIEQVVLALNTGGLERRSANRLVRE